MLCCLKGGPLQILTVLLEGSCWCGVVARVVVIMIYDNLTCWAVRVEQERVG
jgi:hypothetical protein